MVASAMLTGEKRGVSTRRGPMTVLGKVTAPKPINLPSQRLENRGLDPNVEIVPKGTVSWRNTGRSPPASGNAWGAAAFSSSPPSNAGPWNNRLNVSTTRPSSGGSGTRPSTAGSDHSHEPATPNAWGSTSSRPSSASGMLGLAHSQLALTRPCSAESVGSSQLSRFAETSVESGGPWGGSGVAQKMGEGHPHPSQFTLTSVDFPTLGSDKNPSLRPQQGNASTMRSTTTSEGLAQKESLQPPPQDWRDDVTTDSSASKDQRSGDTWKMESAPYGGEMQVLDDRNPQKEGFQRQTFVHSKDSWQYDDGYRNPTLSNPTVDEWARGGPPVGPYGPAGGHGRFPFNPSGYIRPPFDYGPVPYPQRSRGPGGYSRQGEMYGPYVTQPMVAGRPSVPLGHSMYPNQLAYDGYYAPQGVPGSQYCNMDERGEMTMMRMGGGLSMYSGYQRHVDGPKFRHNGPVSGTRPVFHSSISRDQNDMSAYSRAASEGTDKAYVPQADIWMSKDENTSSDTNRPTFPQRSNVRRTLVNNPQSESDDPGSKPSSHRDWGTASSDEQMDFSKPVFGEEAISSQRLGESSLGMESNNEKGANITLKAEQISVSDENKTQDQTKEGLEHPVEVDGQSKEEKKIVAALVDEKVQENAKFGELENQTKNHVLSQEVSVIVAVSKGLVSTPSPERNHVLNTSLKLKGGLSSAAGLKNSSHETPKLKEGVQLLKRRDNHPPDNSVDTEETMELEHSTQGTKGIQESLQKDSRPIRGKLSAHEGDSEWRRKVPKAESAAKVAKSNISNSAHFNRQILSSSVPDGEDICSEGFGDQPIGEFQGQPPGSHDFEAQRTRMKEIAAQRAKQLQRKEEERIKEQKAKAHAKLEELNRRALESSTSQIVGNLKSQSETFTPSGSVSSENFQVKKEGSLENRSSVCWHIGIDNPETLPQVNFGEVKHNRREDHKVKVGERSDNAKGPETILNNNIICDVPSILVSDVSPGTTGKNVSDIFVKSGKNEKAKRDNARRPINVKMDDSKSHMKMDDQKMLPKERESPSFIDCQQDSMEGAPVSASAQTSLSTSESLLKDVSLTEAYSSRAPQRLHNQEFTKQNRNHQKAKQYVLDQNSCSSHLSALEKTEQVMSIEPSHYINPAGENDMLQESRNTTVERISETRASNSDCIPVSRKKKINKSIKSKHKNDRPNVTCSEASEQDDTMAMQSNKVAADLKQESVVESDNSVECVDKYVDIQYRKTEPYENDGNMARDTPAVDRGLLQSTEDTSNGRVPQLKSHFSKRTYRGSQEGRVDKSHGSEGMVWAPVRAVNHQFSANDKQKLDQNVSEPQSSRSVSSEVPAQNPVRNRRAELERYVPKPVAKEQAQHQESRQHHAAGSFGAVQDQMDHQNTQQGTAKNVVSGEARQKNLSTGESKGHTLGVKQGKPNASWRQRNSNEVRENKVSEGIEVEAAFSLPTNEVLVSKTRQGHLHTQDMKPEDIGNHSQLQKPESHKARQLEQLSKSVPAQENRQQSSHSEADQATQLVPMHHLQTSEVSKDKAAQLSSKREQSERFYQANKSRQKLHKIPVQQAHSEGNHQITKNRLSGESEKNNPEKILSHQCPRSSGSWTPKHEGLGDRNEHHMHQKTTSLGETDVHQGNMDSCLDKHNFQSQPVEQSELPSHRRALSDQHEGVEPSAKQQHTHNQYFVQTPVSPHQSEGKNQVLNLRQAASTSYQHRRQSGHGYWQQAGSNARSGSRRTESHEEHAWPVVMQNRVLQDTRPSTPESSFGAGQQNRQDMIKQQSSTNGEPIKQAVQSHPISNQKPQEFYQPKSASTSWSGDKNGINHSSASHGGSFWSGERRSSHVYRGRDHNHARRGRTSGRGGRGFGMGAHETESKTEHPSKQRMLVDATGGAVPHQVAG